MMASSKAAKAIRNKTGGDIASAIIRFWQEVKLHPNTTTLQLPKLGKIKYRNFRNLPTDATIKRASISQQADGWYVSLCIETDITTSPPVANNAYVGIDVGIKALVTLSTGEAIIKSRHLQQA